MGLEINVTPGSLLKESEALKSTAETTVALVGTADVRDLGLLKDISRNVVSLDMSGLTIVSYTFKEGSLYDIKEYGAGELPPYIMAGTNVRSCVLPENVRIIGSSAFSGSSLESIILPESVEEIHDWAFSGCGALKKVSISGSPSLGTGLFKECGVLQEVKFANVTEIPAWTFDGCGKYSEEIPSEVKRVGAYAYRGTSVADLDLSKVTEIGDYAFSNMNRLTSVTFGNREVELGVGVFYNDTSLEEVDNWGGVMGDLLLSHSSANARHMINTEEIGEGAMANNAKVDSITLGAKVKKINAHAFRNMKSLSKVEVSTLEGNVPEVDSTAFSGLENENGRYDISLLAHEDHLDAWRADPVWGLFNIKISTKLSEMQADDVKISIRREASKLFAESTGPIDLLEIYSMDGVRIYTGASEVGQLSVNLDEETDLIIVKCQSGGACKIVKIK